jgi:hypothetical protein
MYSKPQWAKVHPFEPGKGMNIPSKPEGMGLRINNAWVQEFGVDTLTIKRGQSE